MFERFTRGARATVKGAVTQAERAGADSVTEEHLLLALLEQEGGRTSFAVTALGLHDRRASLDAAFAEARRRGGLTRADTDALAGDRDRHRRDRLPGRRGPRRGSSGGGPGRPPVVVVGAPPLHPGREDRPGELAAGRPGARRPLHRRGTSAPGPHREARSRRRCPRRARRDLRDRAARAVRPRRRRGPGAREGRVRRTEGEGERRGGGCPVFRRTPAPVPPGPRRLRPPPRPSPSAAPRSAPTPRPGGGGPPRAGTPSPRDRGPRPGCRRGNGPAGGPGRVPGRP